MKHLKFNVFGYLALLNSIACSAQNDNEEKVIMSKLRDFYTAHATVWSISPSDISPDNFDKKLDSIAGIYLTKNLKVEAAKWLEEGHDIMINDLGIYSESLESMTIEKDNKKKGNLCSLLYSASV